MSDLTVEILKQIRDELKHTREELSSRLDGTQSELRSLHGELKQTREELSTRLDGLERRQTETEIRLATELIAVVGAVHELRDAILEDRKMRETVVDHETRITALERKTG